MSSGITVNSTLNFPRPSTNEPSMALWLFRQARGAIRKHQAKKAVPTTDNSYLMLEATLPHRQHERYNGENSVDIVPSSTSQHLTKSAKETSQERAEARQQNILQWKLLIGLMLPNFLAAVDVTIVAPAIPLISSDFRTLNLPDSPLRC